MNEPEETTCIGCGEAYAPEYPYLCAKCQEEDRRREDYVDESDKDYV